MKESLLYTDWFTVYCLWVKICILPTNKQDCVSCVSVQSSSCTHTSVTSIHTGQSATIQVSIMLFIIIQFSSVAQSCLTLCDPMNRSMPVLPVHPNSWSLLKLMSIESVMPSSHLTICHSLLLLPPIPPSIRVFFQWVNSLHEVAKVLEFQLQHQSFQWTPRTDLL